MTAVCECTHMTDFGLAMTRTAAAIGDIFTTPFEWSEAAAIVLFIIAGVLGALVLTGVMGDASDRVWRGALLEAVRRGQFRHLHRFGTGDGVEAELTKSALSSSAATAWKTAKLFTGHVSTATKQSKQTETHSSGVSPSERALDHGRGGTPRRVPLHGKVKRRTGKTSMGDAGEGEGGEGEKGCEAGSTEVGSAGIGGANTRQRKGGARRKGKERDTTTLPAQDAIFRNYASVPWLEVQAGGQAGEGNQIGKHRKGEEGLVPPKTRRTSLIGPPVNGVGAKSQPTTKKRIVVQLSKLRCAQVRPPLHVKRAVTGEDKGDVNGDVRGEMPSTDWMIKKYHPSFISEQRERERGAVAAAAAAAVAAAGAGEECHPGGLMKERKEGQKEEGGRRDTDDVGDEVKVLGQLPNQVPDHAFLPEELDESMMCQATRSIYQMRQS